MTQVTLYIATSLDGHIAGLDGGLEWLPQIAADGEDYGYGDFYRGVDALVMGYNTYTLAFSGEAWPYLGKPCAVMTQRALDDAPDGVMAMTDAPAEVLARLAGQGAAHVWVVGGARTAQDWLNAGLVDEIILTLVPVLLGSGLPLFADIEPARLTLQQSRSFDGGLVQLRYSVAR
ncbi:dihydrofolate reductase family protein [Chitinibacteraceae bacterium HSL-7]